MFIGKFFINATFVNWPDRVTFLTIGVSLIVVGETMLPALIFSY